MEDRLQTMDQTFDLFIFKTAHKNVRQSWTQWRPHTHTINLFIEFVVKNKRFLGGHVKQITDP